MPAEFSVSSVSRPASLQSSRSFLGLLHLLKDKCCAESRHQVYIKPEKWSKGGMGGSILSCQKSKHRIPLVLHQPQLYCMGGQFGRATCGAGDSGGSLRPQWSLTSPRPHPAAALLTDAVLWHHLPYGELCRPTTPLPPNISYNFIAPLSLLLIRKQSKRNGLEFAQIYIKNVSLVQTSDFMMSNKLQETPHWVVTWRMRIAGGNGQNTGEISLK